MPSKYFVPRIENLEYTKLDGEFPCILADDCEVINYTAKHFQSIDQLAWECPEHGINKATASEYV